MTQTNCKRDSRTGSRLIDISAKLRAPLYRSLAPAVPLGKEAEILRRGGRLAMAAMIAGVVTRHEVHALLSLTFLYSPERLLKKILACGCGGRSSDPLGLGSPAPCRGFV